MVYGKLACRPNSRNKRDLDIAIDYSFRGATQNLDTIHTQYKMYVSAQPCVFGLTLKGIGTSIHGGHALVGWSWVFMIVCILWNRAVVQRLLKSSLVKLLFLSIIFLGIFVPQS